MSYEISDGILKIKGTVVDLPYPVVQVVDLGESVIIRLEPGQSKIYNKNVFSFNSSGDLLWQIEESPHGEQDKPYMSIYTDEHEDLLVGNWNGVDYKVDLLNGHITVSSFKK